MCGSADWIQVAEDIGLVAGCERWYELWGYVQGKEFNVRLRNCQLLKEGWNVEPVDGERTISELRGLDWKWHVAFSFLGIWSFLQSDPSPGGWK